MNQKVKPKKVEYGPLENWKEKVSGDHPASVEGGFKVGDFVIGLFECKGKYAITEAGKLGYVTEIFPKCKPEKTSPFDDVSDGAKTSHSANTFSVMALCDSNPEGRSFPVCHLYFRSATKEEVADRIAVVERARNYLKTYAFKTGDPVELTKPFKVQVHGPFGSGYHTFKKGSAAIVDMSPGEDTDDDDDRQRNISNVPRTEFDMSKMVEVEDRNVGTKYRLRQFIAPSVSLYFPDAEMEELVPIESIRPRQPEMQNAQIILPKGYMETLHMIARRVTDSQIYDVIYENLGLDKVCQKGRGAIALMYGPPGTGKTLTAEMMAEQIGRPLIKLNLGTILDNTKMNAKLKEGFLRAKRYKAILLLDEVDVFIRKRGGGHPIFDENTSMFLRVLEWYDGILFMTTNLANQIDLAIFSRVHVCLEYGQVTKEDRRDIWKSMFPKELMNSLEGDSSHHENMLDELASIDINGREIKMLIQNVTTKAVAELRRGGADFSKIDWKSQQFIKMEDFLSAAELLHEQREDLKK